MGIFENFKRGRQARAALVGEAMLQLRDEGNPDRPSRILPPSRSATTSWVEPRSALGLGAVYRAVEILTGSVAQLGIEVTRHGSIQDANERPAVVRTPSTVVDRRTFVEQTVMSLALRGDFFWLRNDYAGTTTLEVLPPEHVTVQLLENGHRSYSYKGKTYNEWQIIQRSLMLLPGAARGLGPIQAAQMDLGSAIDLREMTSSYFDTTGQPAGILTSEKAVSPSDSKVAKQIWNNLDEDGKPATETDNPSRIKVLGQGLKYEPIMISPKDAMWIEARNLSTVDICRLMGVPASLMLASIEGSSMTYQNVEQDWLAGSRFSFEKYLGKIEDAWSEVAGVGVKVRFTVETLLRSDTKTRYESHKIALDQDTGWMTPDEVRVIEGLPALTDEQRDLILASRAKNSPERDMAELVQKVYLGVGVVITADEARSLLAEAGFPLDSSKSLPPTGVTL